MSLPWIKVAVDLPDHPKVSEFEDALGLDVGVGLGVVISIWCWAARVCPDGKVSPAAFRSLVGYACRNARVALCNVTSNTHDHDFTCYGPPDPAAFADALRYAGLADPDGAGGFKLHDWDKFNGAHIKEAEQNRERQRTFRERHRKALPEKPTGSQTFRARKNVTVTVTENVTPEVTPVTPPDVDGDREREEPPCPLPKNEGGTSEVPLRFSRSPRRGESIAARVARNDAAVIRERVSHLVKTLAFQPMNAAEMRGYLGELHDGGPAGWVDRVIAEVVKLESQKTREVAR